MAFKPSPPYTVDSTFGIISDADGELVCHVEPTESGMDQDDRDRAQFIIDALTAYVPK